MKCLCGCGEEVSIGRKWKSGHNAKVKIPIDNLEKGRESRKNPVKPLGLCKCGCGEIIYNGKDFVNGHHMKTKEYRERKASSAKKQWEDSSEEFKQQRAKKSSEVMIRLNKERNMCSIAGQISIKTQAKNRHHAYDGINFLSKQEMECYKILKSKFQDIKYGIKIGTKTIDFYIPCLNTYIEFHPKFMGYLKEEDLFRYRSERISILRRNNIFEKILFFESLQEANDFIDFDAFHVRPWVRL